MAQRQPLATGFATEAAWDDLLYFIDPRGQPRSEQRDHQAEHNLREIRRKLVTFFAGRACGDAEDLAAETLLRVAVKCKSLDIARFDDRMRYVYGVAHNVLHEWHRELLRDANARGALSKECAARPGLDPQEWSRKEAVHSCLDSCMATLTRRARELILEYYSEERTAKIEHRHELARQFGKSTNGLRIECHRIRGLLRECVTGCLQAEAERARTANPFRQP